MRGVKFRVWDSSQKKFLDSRYNNKLGIDINGDGFLRITDHDNWPQPRGQAVRGEGWTIQQFTGKHDIDGVEMYGGDLVEFVYAVQTHPETGEKSGPDGSFGVYEIFYHDFTSRFKVRVHKKNWFDSWHRTEKEVKDTIIDPACPPMVCLSSSLGKYGICRVIGNIFENPELLNKE